MARTVDERIVKMSLENKDFESKASRTTTIFGKMLDSFKRIGKTNLKKPADDISKINEESNKGSLGKFADAASGATKQLGLLGIAGVTALVNITNRAVDAGIQMVKSFTTKPMMDGFNEYELKMKSIQTIMSNTQGKNSLKDVTGVLDELNTYADKTIYNFAEMTSNIGTFTAAGVGLKDSATAIKGISNLAAASGSNSQQASTAMYQLSQALSSGSVKLQDWNSVVNAGMGGKLFQEALLKTADNMGIANSGAENFRESLQEGWLTTEVLLDTLNRFSKDQSMLDAATKVRTFTQLVDTAGEAMGSGWAETWEIMLGDFEEAGKMWTKANEAISGPIEDSAKARNDLVKGIVDLGGRAKVIQIVSNAFDSLYTILYIVKDAMAAIFPPITAKKIYDIIAAIAEFSKKLVPTVEGGAKLEKIFKALFAIVDIGITVIKTFGRLLLNLIPKGAGGDILDLVLKVSDMILKFREVVKGNSKVNSSFKDLNVTVTDVYNGFKKFLSFITSGFDKASEMIQRALGTLQPYLKMIWTDVKEFFGSFTSADLLTGGLIGLIVLAVKKIKGLGGGVGDILEKIGDVVENFGDNINVFSKLGETLEAMTANIKANTLLQIGIAVGVMALSIKLLSTIPMEDLGKGLGALSVTLFTMMSMLKGMSKLTGGIRTAFYAATVLPALAFSVIAIAGALKVISSMNPEELQQGIKGLVGIFTTLSLAVIAISKFGGKLNTSAIGLIGLATAVVILSTSVKILGSIESGDLIKGLLAMTAILAGLAAFLVVVNKSKLRMSSAIALTITAGTVLVMVQAIKQISNIDNKSLVKGLVTIGAILLELAIFSRLASGGGMLTASVGMMIIAQAVKQLVPPIRELGSIDKAALAQGLTALGITLLEVVLAMRLAKGGLSGSVAILVTAAAINVLVPALTALGNLTWEQIGKGLITLAGALGIIAIAANLIGVAGSVALFAFAAAVLALGVAAGVVALAVLGFMTALNLLAEMTNATVGNIISAIDKLVTGLITIVPKIVELMVALIVSMSKGLETAAPQLFESVVRILIDLLGVVEENIVPFLEKGVGIVIKLMEGIAQEAPKLLEAGVTLIIDLVNGLADTLNNNSEGFTQAVVRLMGAVLVVFVDGIVAIYDVLFGWIPGFEKVTGDLGDKAKGALREHFDLNDVGKIGDDGAKSFNKNVSDNSPSAKKTGAILADNTREGMESVLMDDSGDKAGKQYVSSVGSTSGAASRAGTQVASKTKAGMGSVETKSVGRSAGLSFSSGIDVTGGGANSSGKYVANRALAGLGSVDTSGPGANFGEGFARGIESKSSRVSGAGSWLAGVGKSALEGFLAIFSPSRELEKDGGHFGEGFALGIEGTGRRVSQAAVGIAQGAKGMVVKTMDLIQDSIDKNLDFQPKIKPILDVSQLNMPNLDSIVRLRELEDMNRVANQNRQNDAKVQSVTYQLELNVSEGDLTYERAKQFAGMITTEIKNADDSRRIAIGEEVIY